MKRRSSNKEFPDIPDNKIQRTNPSSISDDEILNFDEDDFSRTDPDLDRLHGYDFSVYNRLNTKIQRETIKRMHSASSTKEKAQSTLEIKLPVEKDLWEVLPEDVFSLIYSYLILVELNSCVGINQRMYWLTKQYIYNLPTVKLYPRDLLIPDVEGGLSVITKQGDIQKIDTQYAYRIDYTIPDPNSVNLDSIKFLSYIGRSPNGEQHFRVQINGDSKNSSIVFYDWGKEQFIKSSLPSDTIKMLTLNNGYFVYLTAMGHLEIKRPSFSMDDDLNDSTHYSQSLDSNILDITTEGNELYVLSNNGAVYAKTSQSYGGVNFPVKYSGVVWTPVDFSDLHEDEKIIKFKNSLALTNLGRVYHLGSIFSPYVISDQHWVYDIIAPSCNSTLSRVALLTDAEPIQSEQNNEKVLVASGCNYRGIFGTAFKVSEVNSSKEFKQIDSSIGLQYAVLSGTHNFLFYSAREKLKTKFIDNKSEKVADTKPIRQIKVLGAKNENVLPLSQSKKYSREPKPFPSHKKDLEEAIIAAADNAAQNPVVTARRNLLFQSRHIFLVDKWLKNNPDAIERDLFNRSADIVDINAEERAVFEKMNENTPIPPFLSNKLKG